MKKIFSLFAILMIATSLSAQCSDTTKSCCANTSYYASAGISIGNMNSDADNFNKASYLSVEVGMSRKNVSFGVDFGFENMFVSSSTRKYSELKTSISYPIGKCNGYVLFGLGAFLVKDFNNFIEYGAGFSYAPCKVGYFAQYSNWAGTNYVSTGISYSF